MSKGKSNIINYKKYNQNQIFFLPPSIEELIPENHLVRIVNDTINRMNINPIIGTYKGGGTSIYHPLMLLKVLVYAYLSKIYSSRRIAKALREDINFMWISGFNKPDFKTINNFRIRLKPIIDQIFGSMIEFCIENKYINIENYFVDGTKIRANAGKFSYTWAKNTKKYKTQTEENIKKLLEEIEVLNKEENIIYGDNDLEELGQECLLTSEKMQKQTQKLNKILSNIKDQKDKSDQPPTDGGNIKSNNNEETTSEYVKSQIEKHKRNIENKKATGQSLNITEKEIQKATKTIEKKLLPNLEKYEEQEKNLAGRNSCSKTDKDATFHRMKDDQLLPSYNLIIGTEDQFILNFSMHQNPGESGLLIPHLTKFLNMHNQNPKNIIGDSAFGSEENYEFVKDHGIENYMKYNTFHIEQTKSYQDSRTFNQDKFIYDEQTNTYKCPNNNTLDFKGSEMRTTDNGYNKEVNIYVSKSCMDCPNKSKCCKGNEYRTISINKNLEIHKTKARENLNSEKGIELRKKRSIDVETVFADIKHNLGFQRFNLRGLEKVNTEIGLLSMAHNFKKIFSKLLKKAADSKTNKFDLVTQS